MALSDNNSSDESRSQTGQFEKLESEKTFPDKLREFTLNSVRKFNIGHLLIILTGLHLFAMSFPSGSGDFVFDEQYYVPAARDLLKLIPSNLEHPFFGKIWGALGITIFGDNFIGWRIFYVLIGVLSVWALYELALNFVSKEKALVAASLFGFETLFFIHTSLDLLEGPPIFFALIGFTAYFKKRYYWSAVAFGLSVLSKEWGLYFIAVLFLYHAWATKKEPLRRLFSGPRLKRLVMFIVIAILVVAIPLWIYDAAYHPATQTNVTLTPYVYVNPNNNSSITTTVSSTSQIGFVTNPIQNFLYYFSYHTSLKYNQTEVGMYPWVYLPWMWILPFDINPQQYYVTTVTVTTTASNGTILSQKQLHPVDWLGIGNLAIWYSIWIIIPVVIAKILTKKVTPLDAFIGLWIVGTYGPTLLEYFLFQRVVYPFYFINVDPALALGIPMVIGFIAPDSLKTQRILMYVWLAAAIIFFILFFPVHPLAF